MPNAIVSEPVTATNSAPAHGRDAVPPPKPWEQHRFHLLDAVRGVAAAMVVLYHASPDHTLYPESFLAVDLFFCLSGFVICASYEQKLAGKMSVKTFALARIIRLYPVHLLGMLIFIVSLYVEHLHHPRYDSHATPATIVLGILLLPVFSSSFPSMFPLNGPAWSLFFEIIANLFYALLLRVRLARSFVLAAICVVSFAWLSSSVYSTAKGFDTGWSAGNFLEGLERVGYSFFAGVLLFRTYRAGFRVRLRGVLSYIASIAVVFSVICCLTHEVRPEMRWTYDAFMIAVTFPALVLLGACCTAGGYWMKVCFFFGEFSYPLYLLHCPLIFVLMFFRAHLPKSGRPSDTAFGMLSILIPVSWWVGKHVDGPTRRYLTSSLLRKAATQPMLIAVNS